MLPVRTWKHYALTMHGLQSMKQHRSILFVEQRLTDFDDVVGSHGQELRIVRGMVQLAER